MEKVAKATQSADAYFIAGTARLRRREFHEARADLDAAIDLHGNFPGLYTMAGQARDALGDTDAAQPAFEQALKADPRDFTANLYLGTMRLKQRDLESARPMLELALQLQPNSPMARLADGQAEWHDREDMPRQPPRWKSWRRPIPSGSIRTLSSRRSTTSCIVLTTDSASGTLCSRSKPGSRRPDRRSSRLLFFGCARFCWLGDLEDLIGGDVLECLDDAAGPMDLDRA